MSEPIAIRRVLREVQKDVPRGGAYLLCRAAPGRGWWDLDDALGRIPGRLSVLARSPYRWHAVPRSQWAALELATLRSGGRVVVHATD